MAHVAANQSYVQLWGHPFIHAQETGRESGVRSCILSWLPTHLVQELNGGTCTSVDADLCFFCISFFLYICIFLQLFLFRLPSLFSDKFRLVVAYKPVVISGGNQNTRRKPQHSLKLLVTFSHSPDSGEKQRAFRSNVLDQPLGNQDRPSFVYECKLKRWRKFFRFFSKLRKELSGLLVPVLNNNTGEIVRFSIGASIQ